MTEEKHIEAKESILKTLEGLSLRDIQVIIRSVESALDMRCVLAPTNI
jgi:hypothetical protein